MKKHLLLLFFLGTIVPLSSCANTVIPTEYCTFAFDGTNCTLQGEKQTSFKVVKGETVNYTFVPNSGFVAPYLENKPETATYQINDNVGVFTMTIENDFTIRAISQSIEDATYKFEFKGTNCTIFGKSPYEEDIPILNKATYTITALGSKYNSPKIDVIKNTNKDRDYKEGKDYTYTELGNFGVIEFNIQTPEGIYLEMHSSLIGASHKVVWNFNNGNAPIVESYNDGDPLSKKPDPAGSKTGILADGEQYAYTFTKWDWEGKQEGDELPDNVYKDYTFNACFKKSSIVTRLYVKSMTKGGTISFRSVYTESIPEDFTINWGDGGGIVEGSLSHYYNNAINEPFTIEIYGSWVTNCIGLDSDSANSNIYEVDLSSTITTISDIDLLFDNSPIETIKIPYSVTHIGKQTFRNSTSLKRVIFEKEESKLTTIGDYAFTGCSSLTSFEIPKNVVSVGAGTFNGCSSLNELTVDSDNKNFVAKNNCVLSKDESTLIASYDKSIIPNTVTTYGEYSCAGNDALFSGKVIIPNNIVTIGNHAFDSCTKITHFKFPSKDIGSLTKIGNGAFSNCTGLLAYKFAMPTYLSYVGDAIFEDSSLSYILCDGEPGKQWSATWNGSLAIYKDYVDAGVSEDFEYIIVKKIDNAYSAITAQYDGDTTSALNIPDSYTYESGSVPNEVIGDKAFADNNIIKGVVNIPKSVVTIGQDSFYNLHYITSINIEADSLLKTISIGAFRNTGLKSINLENAAYLTTIDKQAFDQCMQLTSIKIPSGVIEIGDSAFNFNAHLELDISSATSLKTIGESAFYWCGYLLEQVIDTPFLFSSTIESIGNSAFEGCGKYKTADFSSYQDSSEPIPTLGSKAFDDWNDEDGAEILVYDDTMLGIFKEAWPAYADNIKVKGQ